MIGLKYCWKVAVDLESGSRVSAAVCDGIRVWRDLRGAHILATENDLGQLKADFGVVDRGRDHSCVETSDELAAYPVKSDDILAAAHPSRIHTSQSPP